MNSRATKPYVGVNLRDKKCQICGKPAEARYRREWICGQCLNPEPTSEYLKQERDRANGPWGGVSSEAWNKS